MKKLFGALALVITSLVAYRYAIDRFRVQLMGAAHPAGAFSAITMPRRRRTRKPALRRFEYQDAKSAVDESWIDEQQFVQSATPAGDEVDAASMRDHRA